MAFTKAEIDGALQRLYNKYPADNVNNYKYAVFGEPKTVSEKYRFISMKQSVFKNICYRNSVFENVALTGSSFEKVKFERTDLNGNSFANCSFLYTEFNGLNNLLLANNFSQSNFELCKFYSIEVSKSGILNTLYHNCTFEDVYFHGSTLEGSKFINCKFTNCDFGNLNLDYTTFIQNTYEDMCFPLYQIANIIGAAEFIKDDDQKVFAIAGKSRISMSEYRELIDDLILYYYDKRDYFAVCNLYLAQEDYETAKSYLLDGIVSAVNTRNFRMISNFCELARYHGIIDDRIRYKITKELDEFILSKNIPETQLNYYLIYVGKIKTILNEGASNSITVNYSIKTNTCKKNEEGVKYVNQLVTELNAELSQVSNVEGFNVSVSNHSPFEIIVGVITIIGTVATVAGLVLDIIHNVKNRRKAEKNERDNTEIECRMEKIDKKMYRKYVDARVEQLKDELLLLHKNYEGKALDKHIVEVTQNLKTDMEELYRKDIMIYRLRNKK